MTYAELGIDVRGRTSGQTYTICPQCSHERHKKNVHCLSVNLDEAVFKCHHCGWSGGLDTQEYRPIFRQPMAQVYRRPGPVKAGVVPQQILDWFASRGIPSDVVVRRQITYGLHYFGQLKREAGAIGFPYFRGGETINVKYRDGEKHFTMEAGAELLFYGLDDIEGDTVLIVEGEMDALACEVAGYRSVVSVPNGAPALSAQHYERQFAFLASAEAVLKGLKHIILAVDTDAPGLKLAEELARRLGPERCARVQWAGDCKDANDVLMSHGATVVQECIEHATPWPVSGIVSVNQLLPDLSYIYDHGMERGASTGWATLDRHYTVRTGEWTLVTGIPSHGKALALDTPLPTPTGWKTMGEVQVGDWLLDEQGQPCQVTAATEVMYDHECYFMEFSDRTTLICDANHEWLTRNDAARISARHAKAKGRHIPRDVQPRGKDQSSLRTYPSIIKTREIAKTLVSPFDGRKNHAVLVAEPLQLPDVYLPIPPYVLGAWLGDGTAADGGFTSEDLQILEEITQEGFAVTPHAKQYHHTIRKLKDLLREQGVLGRKHIPPAYLRASITQRMDLLQGLMDTDGSITSYGRCEFTSTNGALADGVYELVAGLGWKPVMISGRAKLYGKDCGPKYRVTFTPNKPVFRLDRKKHYINPDTSPRLTLRTIVRCEPVASVPVRCVEVNSPSHLYLATKAFIPTHNSTFIDNLMINLASQTGWRFAVFSPENYPLKRYSARLLETYTGKPFDGAPHRMSREEMARGAAWLHNHISYLMPEDEDPDLDHLFALARIQVYREGIKGIILDPWNEIEAGESRDQNESKAISRALSKVRRFIQRQDVHVWVIAHPTKMRKAEKGDYEGLYPPPTPYDVNGSANWRNKPDACLCIWRDVEGLRYPENRVEVHIQKIKFKEIGKVGMVELTYDNECRRYYEPPQKAQAWTA